LGYNYHHNLQKQSESDAAELRRQRTVHRVGEKKALPPEMRARVIAAVEGLIAKYPGKTLRQIADIVQIDQPSLSAMRHGRSIGILALLKLRDATGVPLDSLLGLEPPRATSSAPPAAPEVILAGIEASMAALRKQIAAQQDPAPEKRPPDAPRARRR
jgi:transcriptional regulator with XRE-family HTH domain